MAAAAGGFTGICAMPNTDPVTDNQAAVGFVVRQSMRAAQGPGLPDRRDHPGPEGREAGRIRRDGRGRGGGGERRRQAGRLEPHDAHRARVRPDLRDPGGRPLRGPDPRRGGRDARRAGLGPARPQGDSLRGRRDHGRPRHHPGRADRWACPPLSHVHPGVGGPDPSGQGEGAPGHRRGDAASLHPDPRGAARGTRPTPR